MMGLGLCVLYIGISGISAGTNIMVLVISVTVGTLVGEIIDIDSWHICSEERGLQGGTILPMALFQSHCLFV